MTTPDSSPSDLSKDATRIAGGSSIVLLGGLFDRSARWLVKWFLSGSLGPSGLGLYQTMVSVVTVVSAFSPLGLDSGIVLFGARYKKSGEDDKLKGALIAGGILSVATGFVSAVALFAIARWDPWWSDQPQIQNGLQLMAPLIAMWTPLLYSVGCLRSMKDMRSSALAYQIILPCSLLVGMLVLVGGFKLGVTGAIVALLIATLLSLLTAARLTLRHFGPLLQNPDIPQKRELRTLLGFSIPQSLTAATFRLNLQMDILMLAWLGDMPEVGMYTVAASLAMIGSLPTNALASMFNPYIAELIYIKQLERLDGLLKVVTRWLVVGSIPLYLLLFLLPNVFLSIYKPEYQAAASSLAILAAGQVVATACGPSMRLIPMSGHSVLNLINGVVALILNVSLNYLLIPKYGMLGAATATGVTLAAWSIWRIVEVWFMFRCFPFTRPTWIVGGVAVLGAAFIHASSLKPIATLGATVALLVLFFALAFTMARGPEDTAVLERIKSKLQRRR